MDIYIIMGDIVTMLKVLQDNHLTATKEEISVMMDIADKNKDGWSIFFN